LIRRAAIVLGFLLMPVAQPSAADVASPAARASGAELFNPHCGICHLQMGPGTIMLGRRLGPDKALLEQRQDLDPDYVKHVVRNGIGSMPPQTRVDLPDNELDSIAGYLTRPASERQPPGGTRQ
jgi:mono/diheme cytochrome c family protein